MGIDIVTNILTTIIKAVVGNSIEGELANELIGISVDDASERSVNKINDFINGQKSKIEHILSKENMESMNIPEENINFVVAEVKELLLEIEITDDVMRKCGYDGIKLGEFLWDEYRSYVGINIEHERDIKKGLFAVAKALISIQHESEEFEKELLVQISNSVDDINIGVQKISDSIEEKFGEIDKNDQAILEILRMMIEQIRRSNNYNKSETYSINQKYYRKIIDRIVDRKEGSTLFSNSSLKDIYIDTYLTKSGTNGERIQINPILADSVICDFAKSAHNVMTILGEPGQGKSTLSLMLTYRSWISNFIGKPVYYFRLNNAISNICENYAAPKIDNVIYSSGIACFEDEVTIKKVKPRMVILAQKCAFLKHSVIILDGYDELYRHFPSSYTYSDFFDDVNEMAEALDCKIIVTSRITCFDSVKRLYEEVDLLYYIDYLSLEQQIDWMNKKYAKITTEKDIIYNEEQLKQIHTKDTYTDLCELMKITLLFQLVVDSNVLIDKKCNHAKFYETLFSKVIHKVYEQNRKAKRSIENNISDEEVKKYICKLAYAIWCENDEYIVLSSENYTDFIMNNVIIFYFKISNAPDNSYHVEFIHRSFYQYFLALYLKEEFEKFTKNNCIYEFLIKIYPRVLEFDVLDMLKDMADKPLSDVDKIIDIIYKTNCIFKEHTELVTPLRLANNIFINIVALLNCFGTDWQQYTLQQTKLEYAIRTFDCYGINLSNAKLVNMNLSCGSFLGATLCNVDFSNSNLRGATFRGGNLQHIDFTNAILSGADLRGTDLRDAILFGTNLRGADLRGADMRGIRTDDNTNLYGITISQKPNGVHRQITKEIYNKLRRLGNDIDDGTRIIDD